MKNVDFEPVSSTLNLLEEENTKPVSSDVEKVAKKDEDIKSKQKMKKATSNSSRG